MEARFAGAWRVLKILKFDLKCQKFQGSLYVRQKRPGRDPERAEWELAAQRSRKSHNMNAQGVNLGAQGANLGAQGANLGVQAVDLTVQKW